MLNRWVKRALQTQSRDLLKNNTGISIPISKDLYHLHLK